MLNAVFGRSSGVNAGVDQPASPDAPSSMPSFLEAAAKLDYSEDDAAQILSLHDGDFRSAFRALVNAWQSETMTLFAGDQPTDSIGGNGDDAAQCGVCAIAVMM